MAVNIIETIKGYLTPDLISKASNMLGESESGVSKALSGLVPAVFGGLISKATSGSQAGANEVLALSKESYQSGFPGNITNMLSGGLTTGGGGMLENFFGNKLQSIISAIASFAGIKSSSAHSLFNVATPLATGALGKYAMENNLDANGLSSFLQSQKANVAAMLPAGLSGVLGLSGLTSSMSPVGSEARQTVSDTTAYAKDTYERKGGTNWLVWILLLAGVAALLWFLTRGCNNESKSTTTGDSTTMTTMPSDTSTKMAPAPAMPPRESMKVKLADGTEINAFKGGVEDQLVTCLNDASCAAGKDKWFDFDNINFKTGSATLTDSSAAQVSNIVAILKAYPKAKIKIGGYTDKTGNADANKKLSQQRADAVMNAIKTGGANASQLVGAEGYGSEFAKVDASASDEARKVDRRIAVQLREK
ncbi:OmpA family protein [Flavisolibacter ginsenosidimutans]|uniref:OmpA family protein n=1 Tax=Flavisolibacter ginsenosidimutans TaxID=661481 RepID=A0A5B8UN07_9BACT|nr:OmpA family protein [Flavisolibacter ginsenosidimutans]QEC57460.1 OmpA family protein [Flavisolibacter ginsenosidimutans]